MSGKAKNKALNKATSAIAEISSCLQCGDVVRGQELCSAILNSYPNHPELLHLQGVLYKMQGNVELAISFIERAIGIAPLLETAFFNLGIIQRDIGHASQAIDTYQRLLKINPRHHAALFNLAQVLHEQRLLKDAENIYRRFLQVQPRHSNGYSNLATVLIEQGLFDEARSLCTQAIDIDPSNIHARTLLGIIHATRDSLQEVEHAFNKALSIDPQFQLAVSNPNILRQHTQNAPVTGVHARSNSMLPELTAHFERGNVLLERGELQEAVGAYQKGLALNPSVAEILVNLGMALNLLYRYTEAEDVLLRAITLKPGFGSAHLNLGNLYKDQKRYDLAIKSLKQAVVLSPDLLNAWVNLGLVYVESGALSEAINALEKALSLSPRHAEALAQLCHCLACLCQWDALAPRVAQLKSVLEHSDESASPFIVALLGDPRLEYINAKRYSQRKFGTIMASPVHPALPRSGRGTEQLRVGYLSADYRHHATAFLIAGLFEQHDRDRFEVYGYSYGVDDKSAERHRLAKGFDVFRECQSLSDKDAADLIRDDGIDILVDLKGFTQHGRLGILAHRPSPIQVHYLGYPSTTGSEFIDYFVADNTTAPPGLDAYFSEKLVRLPQSYQINDAPTPLDAALPTRASCGLPENGLVFCNFNQSYKITPDLFAVWMRILRQVPESVLWLYETLPAASKALKHEAVSHGIDPARLIFATVMRRPEHLSRLRLADLFVDTFPVNAHTTASDALRVGLSIVTLKGPSFVSRVAASLLEATGLGDLVADNDCDYESLVLSLARDPQRLEKIRDDMKQRLAAAPLFDTRATTRQIEASYLHMARLFEAGTPAEAFQMTPDLLRKSLP